MFSALKDHPFAVEAFFESSLVLTFAIPKEQMPRIPGSMVLDTFHNKWAFVAVALVKTKDLRPRGFPRRLGNDFLLVGYRVFVKYIDKSGRRLRGLFILKSETNKGIMSFMGNIFTHYHYNTTDIQWSDLEGKIDVRSTHSNFTILIDHSGDMAVNLPVHSPFTDWKEARRYAGPLPFTFSCKHGNNHILIIEGVREKWNPLPIKVIECELPFLTNLDVRNVVLASAFIVRNVPYYWKKGKTELWKK